MFSHLQPRHGGNAGEYTIDTVFDLQTGSCGFQVNVACAKFESVVDRGVDQFDDGAGVFCNRGKRQVFDADLRIGLTWRRMQRAIDRPQRILVHCEESGKIGLMRDAPRNQTATARIDPGL